MENNATLTFSEAIIALKQGNAVMRGDWVINRAKTKFIFKQIPAEISLDIIPKMQSVPDRIKGIMIGTQTTLKYNDQIVSVDEDGVVNSWSANADDIFANDWMILPPFVEE